MILKLSAVALLVAFIGAVVSELGFKSKKLISVLCILMLLIGILSCLGEYISEIVSLSEIAEITDDAKCALKVIGVGYVFGFVSSVLTELNEGTISSVVKLACRIEIMLIILPYFRKIINLGLELLKC